MTRGAARSIAPAFHMRDGIPLAQGRCGGGRTGLPEPAGLVGLLADEPSVRGDPLADDASLGCNEGNRRQFGERQEEHVSGGVGVRGHYGGRVAQEERDGAFVNRY